MGPTEVPSQSTETIKIPTAHYEFGSTFIDHPRVTWTSFKWPFHFRVFCWRDSESLDLDIFFGKVFSFFGYCSN